LEEAKFENDSPQKSEHFQLLVPVCSVLTGTHYTQFNTSFACQLFFVLNSTFNFQAILPRTET